MRALLLCLILAPSLACAGNAASATGPAIAVLDFELVDLTLDPNNPEERERTASIQPMLQEALASTHRIVAVDPLRNTLPTKGQATCSITWKRGMSPAPGTRRQSVQLSALTGALVAP